MIKIRYKLPKVFLFPALYILAFILLFACYTSAIFPLGDDLSQLVWSSLDPLPTFNAWIANRVVNSFFSRYLFLLFFPVDKALTGAAFFESFSRYAGLLNAAVAMLFVAICSHCALSGLRVNTAFRLATFFCSLAFTLIVVFGDVTNTIAYNLTLLICLVFICPIFPISQVTSLSENISNIPINKSAFYLLFVAGYFTAFGLELFAFFVWIYFFSILISAIATSSATKLNIIRRFKLAAGSIITLQKKSIIIYYAVLTIASAFLLRTSGRTVKGVARKSVSLSVYSYDFIRGLLTNRMSIFLAACLVIIVLFCLILYRARIKCISNQQDDLNALIVFKPLVFFLVLNISYLALLFAAGYIDGNVLVARSISPTFDIGRIGRSSLFLSPLIIVNLSLCLRCIVVTLATQKKLAPLFVLGSFLLFLSSSNRFLLEIRDQTILKDQVEEAFIKASSANTDTIDIPFYAPSRSGPLLGHPVLPSFNEQEKDWDWYRASYREMFRIYYGKEFSDGGPLFK